DGGGRGEAGTAEPPEALQRVDVDLAEPVTILVARVLATPVTDRLVAVAPLVQTAVDAVLVGVHEGALGDAPLDDGPDRHLPDVGQHAQDDLAAALGQAEDRRLVLVERTPAGSTPQPPASTGTPPLATQGDWVNGSSRGLADEALEVAGVPAGALAAVLEAGGRLRLAQ